MDALFAQLADGWRTANSRLVNRVRELRPEQLDLHSAQEYLPVWAIIGHLACARVYWVCDVLKEPGAATTPFSNASSDCWEDHLDMPRRRDELVMALDSSWNVLEKWLNRWSPETLQQTFTRQKDGRTQWHSYQMVFMRLVMHDAYHIGEVSLILGIHGLHAIEPWSGLQLAAPSTPVGSD